MIITKENVDKFIKKKNEYLKAIRRVGDKNGNCEYINCDGVICKDCFIIQRSKKIKDFLIKKMKS